MADKSSRLWGRNVAQIMGAPREPLPGTSLSDEPFCPVSLRRCTCTNRNMLPPMWARTPVEKQIGTREHAREDEALILEGTVKSVQQARDREFRALHGIQMASHGKFDTLACKALKNDD